MSCGSSRLTYPVAMNGPSCASVKAMLASVASKLITVHPVPCAVQVAARSAALCGMVKPLNRPVVRYTRYVWPLVRPEIVTVYLAVVVVVRPSPGSPETYTG